MTGRPFRDPGSYQIFMLQFRSSEERGWKHPNYDFFGYPHPLDITSEDGFGASGRCWQETGYHGVYDHAVAVRGMDRMKQLYPENDWRVIQIDAVIKQKVVAETKE